MPSYSSTSQLAARSRDIEGPSINIDHPVAGIVVMIGLLFANLMLPAEVEPAAALRLPAFLFVVSLCLIPALSALRDPKSIFRAEHILLVAPVYWLLLDPLQARYDMAGIDRQQIQKS